MDLSISVWLHFPIPEPLPRAGPGCGERDGSPLHEPCGWSSNHVPLIIFNQHCIVLKHRTSMGLCLKSLNRSTQAQTSFHGENNRDRSGSKRGREQSARSQPSHYGTESLHDQNAPDAAYSVSLTIDMAAFE
jgi:hypothetical protein